MFKPMDPQGRLRLFRYGVIVVVVMTFFITLVLPYSRARIPGVDVSLTTFLGPALLATVIAAIIGAVVYIAYYYVLLKKWPWAGGGGAGSGEQKAG